MKRYISLLMGLLAFIPTSAQQSDYYYYYKGNRIDLEVDSTRLYVVSEGMLEQQNTSRTSSANYNICKSSRSKVYNNVVPLQNERAVPPEVYFSTLEIPTGLTSDQYNALIKNVKSHENVWQVLPSFSIDGKQVNVTNNFCVRLKESEDFGELRNMAAMYKIDIVGFNEHMPLWYVLSCNASSTLDVLNAVELFRQSEKFSCCEPEFYATITYQSNDPHYIYQWNLNYTEEINGYQGVDINVEEAWEITKGDSAIVAVFDESIDTDHPDLSDNILIYKGYDISTGAIPTYNVSTNRAHGTLSAGVIAAIQDNEIGLTGIAPESNIISIACDISASSNDSDNNTHKATILQIANGFFKACEKGANVINCPWSCNAYSALLDETIGYIVNECVVVFAAGNYQYESDCDILYPASCNPRILTVGGITPYGKRVIHGKNMGSGSSSAYYSFIGSRYGAELDVVAPAVLIYTTDPSSTTGYDSDFNGTSAACAHVSAIAALILSAHPDLTPDQVVGIIEYTSKKISPDLYSYQTDTLRPHGTWNEEMGYGLVDAGAAVQIADKATRTTYLRNTVVTDTKHIIDYDVEIENAIINEDGMVEIDKEHNVLIKKSFLVKKDGIFRVFESTLPNG